MKTTPLNTASDINEIVYISTDNQKHSSIRTIINEFGEFAFECDIEVKHNYTPYDFETGEQYGFDIVDIDVTIVNVFDSDSEVVQVNKLAKRQIERILAKNLTFEITKKY